MGGQHPSLMPRDTPQAWVLHRCGCSMAGRSSTSQGTLGSPHSTSHPWKAMYKADSRVMPTVTGGASILPQKHSLSNLFLILVVDGGGGHKAHRPPGTFPMDQPAKDTVSLCPCHCSCSRTGVLAKNPHPIHMSSQTILCLIFII